MLSQNARQVTKRSGRFAAALMLVALVSVATAGSAIEPSNNSIPAGATTMRGEVQAFAALPNPNTTATYQGGAISPTGDVDYLAVTCMGLPIKRIGISGFSNDIDINVFDLAGNFVGSSIGTTSTENVDTSAVGRDMLYVKVYGYQGAVTASYDLSFSCQ